MTSSAIPDFHGHTDIGRVRSTNEDQFLISELSRSMLVHQTSLPIEDSTRLMARRSGFLFLVADGLGGAPEGRRASSLALDSVIRSVLGTMPWFLTFDDREEDLEKELKKIFERCELKIQAEVEENPSYRGMATTLTMGYVLWPLLYVVHVGDARAYLQRGSELLQITRDHTLVAPPTREASGYGPVRKVLWNVIGGETNEVWPDLYKLNLHEKDVLLFSTDGLSRHVSHDQMLRILTKSHSARSACNELISAANRNGGRDNTTVIVVRFGFPGLPPRSSQIARARAEPDEIQEGLIDR